MKHLLLVGLGGFIGSVARFLVSKLNLSWHFFSIPMGTLTVNVLGSFIIGILVGISVKSDLISTDLRVFLMVGFCGGFTTFSSFSSENLMLMQNGQVFTMLIYTSLSILLGFLAVYLGYIFTNLL
ncbi:MAG: fluoride efflux transporter CrcB [Paludibacter sp.]|nr:fluoride efflux transporter CrcB [Paludibacter sp.]